MDRLEKRCPRPRKIRIPLLLAALAAASPSPAAAAAPALPTATTVISSADPAEPGQPLVLTATVDGPGWPAGTVVFADDELGQLQAVPVRQGQAVAQVPPLPAGLHQLSATYRGDGTFAPSEGRLTLLVGPPPIPALALSADHNPSPPGQQVALTAVLQPARGYGSVSGTLKIMEGSVQVAEVPVSLSTAPGGRDGGPNQVSVPVRLSPGVHTLQALYSGDSHLAAGRSAPWTEVVGEKVETGTSLVSAANPALAGQSEMLTATVQPATASLRQPSGTLTFRDGANVLGHATVTAGSGSLAVSLPEPGAHALTASYSGDEDFQASTSAPIALQVLGVLGGPTSTATALAAGPSPVAFGQSVTLKASVAAASGPAAPAGSVYFVDEDGAVVGSAQLDAGGNASLSTAALPPGPHRIKAVYSGGARFAHSSSDAAEVSVERAQPSVSALPPVTGPGGTTVGASVSGGPGAAPGGSVTFVEQENVLGTAPVQDQGRALLTTTGLAPGPHRLVAVYNGDSNYASGSTSFTVQAGAAPTQPGGGDDQPDGDGG